MSNYFIKRIRLENFKLIKGSKTIDLRGNKLIVLDGPNGYGKTTIFDAIEILVKGYRNIDKSYLTEYNDGDKPVVYAYDDNKCVKITGEFEDNIGNTFVISRVITDARTNGKISQLKDRFSLYKLNGFDDLNCEEINQDYINTKFNLNPNEEMYNLMHYIQQEDSMFFLKKKEHERRQEINKLFNMNESTNLENKIKKVKRAINTRKSFIEGEKNKIQKEIDDIPKGEYEKAPYKRLILWKNLIWDKEDVIVDKSNYSKIIDEISDINNLVKHKEDFNNVKFNERLDYALDTKNEDIVKGAIILLNNIDKYQETINAYDIRTKFEGVKVALESEEYKIIYDCIEKNLELMTETYKDINFKQMQIDIKAILGMKNDCNELDKLITNLNSMRNKLITSFNQLAVKDASQSQICPLCGYDYNAINKNLLKEIESKGEYFKSRLDDTGKNINELNIELNNKYINKLVDRLDNSIKTINLDEKLIKSLKFYYTKKDRILKFEMFCKSLNIELDGYILKKLDYDEDRIKENVEKFKNLILKKRKQIKDQDYMITNIKILDETFKSTFDSELKNIDNLKDSDIEKKELFIKSIYFEKSNQKQSTLGKKLKELKKQYDILDDLSEKYKDIHEIYIKEIASYSEYMVSKLQIPIYIYSGKIIQDYQGGLGVFIKTEKDKDKQVRLKFVNENNSKHDLINRFSSGQLSGLIISILLSLNKTFSSNGLDSILIDDPLQSMDDINMASFVELLRNEFGEKQIILSTHDERVSRYIRYKYKKFGINSLRYNVKEKLNN